MGEEMGKKSMPGYPAACLSARSGSLLGASGI